MSSFRTIRPSARTTRGRRRRWSATWLQTAAREVKQGFEEVRDHRDAFVDLKRSGVYSSRSAPRASSCRDLGRVSGSSQRRRTDRRAASLLGGRLSAAGARELRLLVGTRRQRRESLASLSLTACELGLDVAWYEGEHVHEPSGSASAWVPLGDKLCFTRCTS